MTSSQPSQAKFEWNAGSVRALRRFLGTSQSTFAAELGVRQQTVSEWETGMYRPRGASATLLTLFATQSGFIHENQENGRDGGHAYVRERLSQRRPAALEADRQGTGAVPTRPEVAI